MRALIFDAGPLISLTLNNLLSLIEPLKEKFKGDFIITDAIKSELIDKPIKTKRFEFEALQTLHYIENGTISRIKDNEINTKTQELLEIANNCFKAKGNYIQIIHKGEMSCIAAALLLDTNVIVVDERTTRLIIENPHKLKNILEHRLHTKVDVNDNNLKKFRNITKNIKIIRSVELVTIAFELGLVDKYIPNIENGKRTLLESLLWGVKLDGCSVSKSEIGQIMRLEKV